MQCSLHTYIMSKQKSVKLIQFISFMMTFLKTKHFGPRLDPELQMFKGTLGLSIKGRMYSAFEGIRYAKPPTGELRFKEPVPVEENEQNLRRKVDCLHVSFPDGELIGQEDCLFLNVYVPNHLGHKPLPVMVWIHGSPFSMAQSTSRMQGPDRLMDFDLILVTMSYRIGPLGFMSLENSSLPGNYGFMDQRVAIDWVIKYIGMFRGEPGMITLAGHGHGAADALFHVHALPDKIGKVIALSGSIYSPWLLSTLSKVKERTSELIHSLNCPFEDDVFTSETDKCLRSINAINLVRTAYSNLWATLDNSQIPYRLVVDGNMIKHNPWDEVPKTNFSLLLSLTRNETAFFFADKYSENRKSSADINNKAMAVFKKLKDLTNTLDFERMPNFMGRYEAESNPTNRLIQMTSDTWFFYPAHLEASRHVGHLEAVMFNYKTLPNRNCFLPKHNRVASHGDELPFLFLIKGCELHKNDDLSMADRFTTMIANFVIEGNSGLPKNVNDDLTDITEAIQKPLKFQDIDPGISKRLQTWKTFKFLTETDH